MKKVSAAFLACIILLQHLDATISCNERVRHGRDGAAKALAASASLFAFQHTLRASWANYSGAHSATIDLFETQGTKSSPAYRASTLITLSALAYLTYTFGSEAMTSLNIFFDDNEEDMADVLRSTL